LGLALYAILRAMPLKRDGGDDAYR